MSGPIGTNKVSAKEAQLPQHPTRLEGHRSVIATTGNWVFVPGILTYEPENARLDSRSPFHQSEAALHTRYIYGLIESALEQSGSALGQVVCQTIFARSGLLNDEDGDPSLGEHVAARNEIFGPTIPPTSDTLISDLYVRDSDVEIEVVAVRNEVDLHVVSVADEVMGPRPDGAAHAVEAGGWLFVGAIGPTTWNDYQGMAATNLHDSWYQSDVELQADFVLRALNEILAAGGSSLDKVVHATVYITSIRDIPVIDRVWRRHFVADPPARLILPVLRLPSPGWRIQVDAIAVTAASGLDRRNIIADDVPQSSLHEPHATRAGDLLFTSGIMAVDEFGRNPRTFPNLDYPDPTEDAGNQARAIFEIMASICSAGGTSIEHVLRERNFHPADLLHRQVLPYYAQRAEAMISAPVGTGIGIGKTLSVPGCTILADAVAAIV